MKKIVFLSMALIVLMAAATSVHAQTFACTIQNQTIVGNQFKFDIYIQTTSGTLYVGNCDFVVTYDQTNFTSPTISKSISAAFLTGAGAGYGYNMSASIVSSNRIILNVTPPTWDDQTAFDAYAVQPSGTAPGTKVATVTVTGISNASGFANIQWRTTSPNNVVVSTTGNTNPWIMTNVTANGTFIDPVNAVLPLQMASFIGVVKAKNVELSWKTTTEVNTSKFEIERRAGSSVWEKIGEKQAVGTSNTPQQYTYVDNLKNMNKGNILYRLKSLDNDGSYKYSNEVEVAVIPAVYSLEHNYPNPFNPQTKIQYTLPENARVQLVIFDIIGRQVAQLVNEEQTAGYYEKTFDGLSFSSGMYFYRITTQVEGKNTFTQVKKMMLIK